MCKVSDIIAIIEEFAPPSLSADYDNSGLKVGSLDSEVSGVLVTVDTNIEIVAQAIGAGCNLIIEHHPSIWSPLRSIDTSFPTCSALCAAIKADIAIYSAHTNVDFTKNGLNDYVAKIMGLKNIVTMSDRPDSGRVGELSVPMKMGEYAKKLKEIFSDNNIRTVGNLEKTVKKVAVINGGGGGNSDGLMEAIRCGADIFVTADVKHSVARLAKDLNYGIIECAHYNMESFFCQMMAETIAEKSTVAVFCAEQSSPYNQ